MPKPWSASLFYSRDYPEGVVDRGEASLESFKEDVRHGAIEHESARGEWPPPVPAAVVVAKVLVGIGPRWIGLMD